MAAEQGAQQQCRSTFDIENLTLKIGHLTFPLPWEGRGGGLYHFYNVCFAMYIIQGWKEVLKK